MNNLKEALQADAFYIEPKDKNIIYLNLTRLGNLEQWIETQITKAKIEQLDELEKLFDICSKDDAEKNNCGRCKDYYKYKSELTKQLENQK